MRRRAAEPEGVVQGAWRPVRNLRERFREQPPEKATIFVAVLTAALVGLHLVWLNKFRFGYVTEWDESGYMSIALDSVHALRSGGLTDLAHTVLGQGLQAPLLPLVAVPFNLLLGDGVDSSLVAELPFYAILVLATYGLGRRLVPPWWAALAAACVAGIPLATDYTRIFHFSVPASAMFTAALWALLRSESLERRGWAIASGTFLGLTLLSRTMTIAYLPGFVAAAAVLGMLRPGGRRDRLVNLALLLAVGGAVAAVWYLPNRDSVAAYLFHFGYGAESASYGARHSIFSVGYWTAEARGLVGDLYLPLTAVLAVSLIAAAASALVAGRLQRPKRDELLGWLGGSAAVLAIVVAEGYLSLSSSRNQGTAFTLPWLPALVVLIIAATARIRERAVRAALVGLIAAVSVFDVAMKSGLVAPISGPAELDVPGIGDTAVSDGRGVIQLEVLGSGYAIGGPTDPLPDLHKRWLPFAGELTRWSTRYAAEHGRRSFLGVGLNDALLSNTRFSLASQLKLARPLPSVFIKASEGDTVSSYRKQLEDAGNDLLITGQPKSVGGGVHLTRARVEKAAEEVGFKPVRQFRAPDGRELVVWWRDVEPPAHLYD